MISEARRRIRHEFNERILCYHCQSPPGYSSVKVPFLITIHDISYGGLGILVDHLLYEGTILRFRMNHDDTTRDFEVIVKWCKYSGTSFVAGVAFNGVVRDDILFLHSIVHPLELNGH